ncbi:unnamed protein product [Brassicogethes aeneus]|uniref:Protein FAM136A n=1 Tax=Brassicogethes aeneus TaxID=1431903 RepID=A0A9P0AYY8_BRAAE|nr:unnamed protein product [Brassicogethes aeneus]
MVELQRQRVEQEMTKLVTDIDLQYLRKMQVTMHKCAAKCCENRDLSMERVQQCVEKCSAPLNFAQSYVQKEFEQLQNKLQRCVMDCNDDIRVKMGPNPTESEIEKFTTQFEKCATKCVDKQLTYMPSLYKRMKAELEKNQE